MPEPPEKRPDETRDRKPDGEYDVVSTDMHGEPSHEQVEAKSVTDLVENLRSKGLQVSSVTGPRARRAFEPRKSDPEDFAFFNAELANACRNGMPLPGALRALSRDMSGRRCRPRARRDVQRRDLQMLPDFAAAQRRDLQTLPDLAAAQRRDIRMLPDFGAPAHRPPGRAASAPPAPAPSA